MDERNAPARKSTKAEHVISSQSTDDEHEEQDRAYDGGLRDADYTITRLIRWSNAEQEKIAKVLYTCQVRVTIDIIKLAVPRYCSRGVRSAWLRVCINASLHLLRHQLCGLALEQEHEQMSAVTVRASAALRKRKLILSKVMMAPLLALQLTILWPGVSSELPNPTPKFDWLPQQDYKVRSSDFKSAQIFCEMWSAA
jgi:hypothetical protein